MLTTPRRPERTTVELGGQRGATCPNADCAKPIPVDHPYSWCTACGEQLPGSIQLQLTKLQEGKGKAEAARAALGSQPEIEEICTRCGTHFMASAKLDFLGFRELTCPSCHLQATAPLRRSYRITYWVFLSLWTFGLIQMFLEKNGSPYSGPVGLCLWILLLRAVLKDLKVCLSRGYSQQPG